MTEAMLAILRRHATTTLTHNGDRVRVECGDIIVEGNDPDAVLAEAVRKVEAAREKA